MNKMELDVRCESRNQPFLAHLDFDTQRIFDIVTSNQEQCAYFHTFFLYIIFFIFLVHVVIFPFANELL